LVLYESVTASQAADFVSAGVENYRGTAIHAYHAHALYEASSQIVILAIYDIWQLIMRFNHVHIELD
jgi:hypothetical protein